MKRIGILMLILFTTLLSGEWLQAQRVTPLPGVNPRIPHSQRPSVAALAPQLMRRVGPARLPASATANVLQSTCPPEADALGAVCGYVPVPLDRNHPNQGTIKIYFELYTHSGSGLAESAILYNNGGPGLTTTGLRNKALYLVGQNLDVHDLLLIDDRGRGYSAAIDCAELQHATVPWDPAMADCAAQLGKAASRYGTGDVAQDTEAVRAALGYDKVDYFGISYGGADAAAYATRFGDHLRSLVLDAPFGTPGVDESRFVWEQYRTHAEPRRVRLDCLRSANCSPDHPFPDSELDALIWTVRLWPVEGDAYDANGNYLHVRIDEDQLLNNVIDSATGNFANTGELLAAAASLWAGDRQPLLRLGAEGYYSRVEAEFGDPTFFSIGSAQATACVDMKEPWAWSVPVSERMTQYASAVRHSHPGTLRPSPRKLRRVCCLPISEGSACTGRSPRLPRPWCHLTRSIQRCRRWS